MAEGGRDAETSPQESHASHRWKPARGCVTAGVGEPTPDPKPPIRLPGGGVLTYTSASFAGDLNRQLQRRCAWQGFLSGGGGGGMVQRVWDPHRVPFKWGGLKQKFF
jgi:hypothetical protein